MSVSTRAHRTFHSEAKINKATKVKAEEMDKADMLEHKSSMQSDANDLKSTQEKLMAANKYEKSLAPRCIAKVDSYEESYVRHGPCGARF